VTAPARAAPPANAAAPARGFGGPAGRQPQRPAPGSLWGRWRSWLGIGLVVVLAGVVIALLQQPSNQYLAPDSTAATGTHALADVLAGLGRKVTAVTSVRSAAAAASAGTTLVITSPGYLSAAQLATLAARPANVLLVEPDPASLAAIAPGVSLSATGIPVTVRPPGCALPAATLAGTADMGGTALTVRARPGAVAEQCYRTPSGPALVQLSTNGRDVTVLGAATALTNASLASEGNAALAINLLPSRRIIWLVPPFARVPAAPGGPRSFASLVPLAAWLVTIQLVVAVLLAVGWRARRLGPLVPEPLPVVVRAAETVEGHGRLYQSRRSRARAAAILRASLLSRVSPAVGLPARAGPDAVVVALAQRAARDPAEISRLLFGSPPGTDQALVELARNLDQLEREVVES
jgi:Domain of unknown function (DUF4350)